jgi:hypothetical protein
LLLLLLRRENSRPGANVMICCDFRRQNGESNWRL